MHFSAILAALLPVGLVMGKVIDVKVGENDTLTYNPSNVTAEVGDTIAFEFVAKNHTITQSTFATPCSNFTFANGSTGVDSGFQFVAANTTSFPVFSFTVMNTSTPLWFYCRQTGHCEKGMVFAVNPTAEKSFAAFQAAAMATSANGTSTNSSSTSAGSSGSTSSSSAPASTSTTKANGAGAVQVRGAAFVLSGVGLAAGLLL